MILFIFQIIIALFVMILIILQGNPSFVFKEKFIIQKRGWEKKLYWLTWIAGFIFIFLLLLNLFLAR